MKLVTLYAANSKLRNYPARGHTLAHGSYYFIRVL